MKLESKSEKLYFVNAYIDYAFIGLLSVVAYFIARHMHSGHRTDRIIYLATTLSWIVNNPHFSATNYRLYQSSSHIKQYMLTSFLIPIVVGMGVIGSFFAPTLIAPYFVKLFTIWSPYHFSGQTLGISLLYARRAEVAVQKWERFCLSGFIYGTFLYQSSKAETYGGFADYYSVRYPLFEISSAIPKFFYYMMVAFGLGFVILMAKQMKESKRFFPPIVFLPMAVQYLWFVHGNDLESFQEFVPLFHSLQYLLIAWAMEIHYQASQATKFSVRSFVLTRSGIWAGANLFGGVFLFYLLPLGFVPLGWSMDFSNAIMSTAVQLHHFFVDGVIWKLKRSTVSSPLMSNVFAVLREGKKGQATV